MNGAIRWMAHNHVAANLLMMVFIVGGLVMARSVKQEVFPEVSLDRIQVSVPYPGAAPEEVEDGIVLKVEESLTEVDGIKEIQAEASEGMAAVTATVREGEDPDLVLQDIKNAVDRITTLPEDAEEPVISKLLNRREVISVVVYGDLSARALREQAERIRDDLLEEPGITQVDLSGVRPYEISIEVPEENLRRYGLTLDQVAERIRRASLDLPGGAVKTAGGEVLLRTKERRYHGPEYADIVVVSHPDGSEVRVGDIARVVDGFAETDELARFDGRPAAMVQVYRVGDQKPTEISEAVQGYVARRQAALPPTVHLATWNDSSELLASRMHLLLKNACYGLALVLVILGLFLEIRLALWVMLGIPISFLGALFLMPGIDLSINMISLFAFIMALGIVVDDAIVVGESIYEHRQRAWIPPQESLRAPANGRGSWPARKSEPTGDLAGRRGLGRGHGQETRTVEGAQQIPGEESRLGKPYLHAAIDGVLEVAQPVVFSVLTTVVAFLPLLFVQGMLGKFIKVIPAVVIAILTVSLIESLFVLPSHLALGRRLQMSDGVLGGLDRLRRGVGIRLQQFVTGPYQRFLALALHYRYATLAAALAVLMLCVGTVRGGLIKFVFMPEVEGDVISASLEMPLGTPVEETDRVQQRIVRAAQEVVAEYDRTLPAGESILRHIYALVGSTIAGGHGPQGGATTSAAHLCDITMFLVGSEERDISSAEITRRWRERVGEVPGIESLTFQSDMVRFGANIDVRLEHEDYATLTRATERVKAALAEYPGVGDIADDDTLGKRELKIRLRPEARTLGVTETELGRQVRAAFYGAEALRLQRGRNEVKVMVRYPEVDRRSLWDLENLRIRTLDGGELPLGRAAQVTEGQGFSQIHRFDRKRVVDVTASVNKHTANPGEILDDLKTGVLAQLAADYPGLTFNMEGEEKERRESMGSMGRGFQLALFGIYALLAIPFRSYVQPAIVMAAIPFGAVGAILGHLIMGYNLSMLSMFGMVALSGVVVNDSLLLIDRANQNRRDGTAAGQAILDAAVRRFRPILLTSLTTFFGLAPMILETSVQARFLIPMAISLGFGILFATAITLLLIPALYLVVEDLHDLFGVRSHIAPAEAKGEAQ